VVEREEAEGSGTGEREERERARERERERERAREGGRKCERSIHRSEILAKHRDSDTCAMFARTLTNTNGAREYSRKPRIRDKAKI
jgi:hypothetical protein